MKHENEEQIKVGFSLVVLKEKAVGKHKVLFCFGLV